MRGDSTCIDSAAAVATAERLVTGDQVNAIVGGDCSGVTIAMLQQVAKPNGIVMISPSATSPALSTIEDDGLFFRTAPSDARQGEVVADILQEMDIQEAALTYTNNDYGKGLADSIAANFEERGGTITINAPHEDGKGDYSAEVAALAAAGGDILIVAGYLDQGGKGIIQASLDTGAFDRPEEQPVVLDRRQGRRGRGRRDHHDAVRLGHLLQHGDGHARAVAADDGVDLVPGYQPLGRCDRGSGVDARRISPHGDDLQPPKQCAAVADLLHGQLRTIRHGRRQRLDRPGVAEDHSQLDVLRERCAKRQQHQQQS